MSDYKFATDSENGTIAAESFDQACRKLDAMVAGSDGGSGWVDDVDGYRYSTDGEESVDPVGGGCFEAKDGTVIYIPEV